VITIMAPLAGLPQYTQASACFTRWLFRLQTVLRYGLGLLYVNFKFIWEGAMGVLRLEAAHAPDDFWALFINRVRHAAALTHTTRPAHGASRVTPSFSYCASKRLRLVVGSCCHSLSRSSLSC
jgi:hypothetical protein